MELYFDNYSSDDADIVKKQLKSEEIQICGILKRCRFGFPQIIFLNPVQRKDGLTNINYEAISNIMWLTCPYLNFEIHELENSSNISKIKSAIQNDIPLKKKMLTAHANYYFTRNFIFERFINKKANVINKEDNFFSNIDIDIINKGIGGLRDLSSIKCLHLHFCHYFICKENIAGHIAFHLLGGKIECDNRMCNKFIPGIPNA